MNRDDYGLYEDFDLAGVIHRMRWIELGTFMMGSPEDESGRLANETLHQVTLTRGFWLAETTCTQAAWKAVMDESPSYCKGDDRPVERVSWKDCQDFLKRANAMLHDGGLRLPTEAEWEYACRAGTTTPFWFGDKITAEQAHYERDEELAATVDVKALPCNAWGLYQMHGNVWEWCQDRLNHYPVRPVNDPCSAEEGCGRVVRGGSWVSRSWLCRSACRDWYGPSDCYDDLGLRLARSATEE